MTSSRIPTLALLLSTLAACGNYSNEDLEFMNAVPAAGDISANMPPAALMTDEAELSKLTHETIRVFNLVLDQVLGLADHIRTYQPTSREPNMRIWGPAPGDRAGWQWRFRVTRNPANPTYFEYWLEMQRTGVTGWLPFIDGNFEAASGVRRGIGMIHADTQMLRDAGFGFDDRDGRLRSLAITYSTREFPISVVLDMVTLPNPVLGEPPPTETMIRYEYGQQASGQGAMSFEGTDSTGRSIKVISRWLASGTGRGDATWADPAQGLSLTRTECWDDAFVETYDYIPWPVDEMPGVTPPIIEGNPALCPEISTLSGH